MCRTYVSERLKNYNVEQIRLEPTNCLDVMKYEFHFLESKTFDNFNQIHANKYYVSMLLFFLIDSSFGLW